jgi:hypothetical protein
MNVSKETAGFNKFPVILKVFLSGKRFQAAKTPRER